MGGNSRLEAAFVHPSNVFSILSHARQSTFFLFFFFCLSLFFIPLVTYPLCRIQRSSLSCVTSPSFHFTIFYKSVQRTSNLCQSNQVFFFPVFLFFLLLQKNSKIKYFFRLDMKKGGLYSWGRHLQRHLLGRWIQCRKYRVDPLRGGRHGRLEVRARNLSLLLRHGLSTCEDSRRGTSHRKNSCPGISSATRFDGFWLWL